MRSPSWIRAARSPRPPPLARFVNPQPSPDLAAQIQDGDLITKSGFFEHPKTACEQAIHMENRNHGLALTKPKTKRTKTYIRIVWY